MTKDELVRDNGELIELQVEELGAELVRDAAVEMRKALEKALKGSKHFRLR